MPLQICPCHRLYPVMFSLTCTEDAMDIYRLHQDVEYVMVGGDLRPARGVPCLVLSSVSSCSFSAGAGNLPRNLEIMNLSTSTTAVLMGQVLPMILCVSGLLRCSPLSRTRSSRRKRSMPSWWNASPSG